MLKIARAALLAGVLGFFPHTADANTITIPLPFNGDVEFVGSITPPIDNIFVSLALFYTPAPEDSWIGIFAAFDVRVFISGINPLLSVNGDGNAGVSASFSMFNSQCVIAHEPCVIADFNHSRTVLPVLPGDLPLTLHISSFIDEVNLQDFSADLVLRLPDGVEAPLPAALPMFMGGAGLIGLFARRRKQKRAA